MVSGLIDDIVAARGFLARFSDEETQDAEDAAARPAAAGDNGRADCRRDEFVTIDDETARDFDDAVGCRPLPGGDIVLAVAIADVAAYVAAGTPLDAAARARGNSVYLPDRVLPMLPPALSTGACSLQPDKERLCLICEMRVAAGGVRGYRFFRAVIRSRARLSYDEAAAMMQNGGGKFAALPLLARLCDDFRRRRAKRGAMILERPEKTCHIAADGKISAADKHRNIAHWAIEEAMIAANRCAADFLIRKRQPALHRIHAAPPPDNMQRLRAVLSDLRIPLPPAPRAADFAAALTRAEERDAALADALTPFILGALSRASYSPDEKTGHFGLACRRYLHFTSPIRRYPDLLTHRAIIAALAGAPPLLNTAELADIGARCSAGEVNADKAGWEARQRLMCVSARRFIGCDYDGYVSGITNNGFFVTVADLGIDGFVRLSTIAGYWRYEEAKQQLSLSRGDKKIKLGDRVNVRLKSAVPENGRVDYELMGAAA